jgi:GNAT superfamily N-acetyltransferase
MSSYTTQPLTAATWPDFVQLFQRSRGMAAGCWCMYYHRPGPIKANPHEERPGRNRRDHAALVERSQAHGILVYQDARPVGWCQFGPKSELPRIDAGRKYRALKLPTTSRTVWRITCFFVEPSVRRQGIARIALRSALAEIRAQGGGQVEAYPATHPGAVATWFGSLPMFQAEGFRVVAPFGQSNVLVQRLTRASPLPRGRGRIAGPRPPPREQVPG